MGNTSIKALIAPSINTINATLDKMGFLVSSIHSEISSILDTLKMIDDTFAAFTRSTGLHSQISIFNPLSFLSPGVISLVQGIAKSKGLSITDWNKFINSILEKFKEYTARLATVSALSKKYNQMSLTKLEEINKEEASEHEAMLLSVKSETHVWRKYIEEILKWVTVFKDVFSQKKQIEDAIESDIQIKKTKSSLPFLSSIDTLIEKVKDFDKQIKKIVEDIGELEKFLDLAVAQIQMHSGKISAQQSEILEARVATFILVPNLKNKITGINRDKKNYITILGKLEDAFAENSIDRDTYKFLLDEYNEKITEIDKLLEATSNEAHIWKTEGISFLDSGLIWLQQELEIVKARKLVGQISREVLIERSRILNREKEHLHEAKLILESL